MRGLLRTAALFSVAKDNTLSCRGQVRRSAVRAAGRVARFAMKTAPGFHPACNHERKRTWRLRHVCDDDCPSARVGASTRGRWRRLIRHLPQEPTRGFGRRSTRVSRVGSGLLARNLRPERMAATRHRDRSRDIAVRGTRAVTGRQPQAEIALPVGSGEDAPRAAHLHEMSGVGVILRRSSGVTPGPARDARALGRRRTGAVRAEKSLRYLLKHGRVSGVE